MPSSPRRRGFISDVDASIVFETPAATMWEQAIRRLGADPGKLHSGHGVH